MRQRTGRGRRLCLMLLLTAISGAGSLQAQAGGAERVLIRDVRLIDREGEAEDVVANILIKKGRLDLVTKDRIPCFGSGSWPSTPKKAFCWASSSSGSRRASSSSTRTRERTSRSCSTPRPTSDSRSSKARSSATASPPSPTPKRRSRRGGGWPTHHHRSPCRSPTRTRRGGTTSRPSRSPASLLRAVVLDRQRWLSQDAESEEQVGDLDEFNRGEIRGFRFGLVGTFNFKRPWVYTLAGATNAFDKGFETEKNDDITLFDYRWTFPSSSRPPSASASRRSRSRWNGS